MAGFARGVVILLDVLDVGLDDSESGRAHHGAQRGSGDGSLGAAGGRLTRNLVSDRRPHHFRVSGGDSRRLASVPSAGSSARLVSARRSRLDLHRLRLLGGVRMIGPCVDLQLRQLLAREAVAGSIPLTAIRMTSSGRRSSISARVRDFNPPG